MERLIEFKIFFWCIKIIKHFFMMIYKIKAIRIILVVFLIINLIGLVVLNSIFVYSLADGYINGKKSVDCPADGVAKAMRSVVKISGDEGSGSGFWIEENIVVTNNHVVMDNSDLVATNPRGLKARAKVIETDTMKDLALLEIEGSHSSEKQLEWRTGKIYVAEDTYAIGYPGGRDLSITKGIISAIAKDDYDDRMYIQTDSAINPGNSGGPLLDKCGRVMGVNTSTVWNMQNISFSLKYDQASKSVDNMLAASAKSSNEEKKNSYPSEQAEVVAKYYTTLSLGKLDDAYAFYSKKRQTKYLLENWKKQMENSGFIRLKTVEDTEKTNAIKVDFLATDFLDNYSFQTKEYAGTWTLVRENNMWKMDESNIADLGPVSPD